MSRQPRERVFTLSPVEAWLDEHDEKDDDDERRELLTGLLVKTVSAPLIRERHVKLARRLLARGADPNPLKASGYGSPLHAAARARGAFALDLVEALLAGGAAPNARTAAGAGSRTPLMVAIEALSLRPARIQKIAVLVEKLRKPSKVFSCSLVSILPCS